MNYLLFFTFYNLAHQSVFLDWLIVFSSNILGLVLIVLVMLFIFLYKRKTKIKELSIIIYSSLSAWLLASLLKYLINAPRPFVILEDIKPLFLKSELASFPSGHAMIFAAFATSVYFYHKKLGIACAVVALIIGLARIASGVHFPIDILFGYLLGVLISFSFKYLIHYKK